MVDDKGIVGDTRLRRALSELAQGKGVRREDLLEALDGELAELRRCWGLNLWRYAELNPERALRLAQSTILLNLEAHIKALASPRGVSQNLYRYVVSISFNMQNDKMHAALTNMTLTERREWLLGHPFEGTSVPERTSGRYLNSAITQIEKQILAAGYEPIRPVPRSQVDGGSSNTTDESPALQIAVPAAAVSDTPPARHLSHRKVIALASTAAVIVIGVPVLLVVHPWSSSQPQPPTTPAGPLAVTITSLQSRLDGDSVVFPTAIADKATSFETTYQNDNGDVQPIFERALQAGAYSFGSEVLNLEAHTASNDQLAITGIHAVNIKRGPVATGAVINDPGGAGGGPSIGFDLDQPAADARTDSNGTLGTPYFQAQSLGVTKVGVTSLELEFIGHGASYSFNVEIDYMDGQQPQHLILLAAGGSGQSFVGRVSGTLCDQPPNLSADALAQFKKLQYGGVVQPVGNADGTSTMQSMSSADFKAALCGG